MKNIRICRCVGNDAEVYQGYIEPEDKRWRLFVDHDGIPHLLVQVTAEGDNPGDPDITGMINIESMMHEDTTIRSLMTSKFGGYVDPGDVQDEDFSGEAFDFGPGPHDFTD